MSVFRFGIYVEDHDDEIYRVIDVKGSHKFVDLHLAIAKSFKLRDRQSSFFVSNNRWQKLNEITLGYESVFETAIDGEEVAVELVMPHSATNLIYFNEDAEENSFLIQMEELLDAEVTGVNYPAVIETKGNLDINRNIFKEDFGVDTDDVSGLEGREGEDM